MVVLGHRDLEPGRKMDTMSARISKFPDGIVIKTAALNLETCTTPPIVAALLKTVMPIRRPLKLFRIVLIDVGDAS